MFKLLTHLLELADRRGAGVFVDSFTGSIGCTSVEGGPESVLAVSILDKGEFACAPEVKIG